MRLNARLLAGCLLASLFIFSLGACQVAGTGESSPAMPTTAASLATTAATTVAAETSASLAADHFPVSVPNAAGESVTVAAEPKAIIATSVWAGEMLLDLVEPGRIAALSAWGDDPVLSAAAEKARAVANRVATTKSEGIVALQPDLVIIDTFSDPDGSLSRTLKEAGITVLLLNSPTNLDQVKTTITTLATATGSSAAGARLVGEIDAQLQAVSSRLAQLPADKRLKAIYYEDKYDAAGMLCAYGEGSPFASIAAAAGLVNVCNAPNYSAVSKEKVVGEWQPDVLVVPGMHYDENYKAIDDQGASYMETIKADPLLATLPAVKENRILALPYRYQSSTSQYMVQAVVDLARAAYPEYFK